MRSHKIDTVAYGLGIHDASNGVAPRPRKRWARQYLKGYLYKLQRDEDDVLEQREQEEEMTKEMAPFVRDRKVTISITETDCDHCTGTLIHTMDAKPRRVVKYVNDVYDAAEGPVSWGFVPPDEVQQAEEAARDSFHDGILEAHENGHAHFVPSPTLSFFFRDE